MEYSKIVAVTGLPGLFELINSKTDGAIVRSLDDKTTRFVSSRVHNFSHLESIEVYTTGDNVNLVDILNAMAKDGGTLPDEKDPAAIKKYFETVYPELDFERVYASDMKKMVKWYDVLKKNNIEIKLTEIPEEEEEETQQPEPETEKPVAKKETKKDLSAAAEEKKAAKKEEEKPAAKTATKKATATKATKETKEKSAAKDEKEEKSAPAKKKSAAPSKSAKKK